MGYLGVGSTTFENVVQDGSVLPLPIIIIATSWEDYLYEWKNDRALGLYSGTNDDINDWRDNIRTKAFVMHTAIWSLALQAPPGEIPERRARNSIWTLESMQQIHSPSPPKNDSTKVIGQECKQREKPQIPGTMTCEHRWVCPHLSTTGCVPTKKINKRGFRKASPQTLPFSFQTEAEAISDCLNIGAL